MNNLDESFPQIAPHLHIQVAENFIFDDKWEGIPAPSSSFLLKWFQLGSSALGRIFLLCQVNFHFRVRVLAAGYFSEGKIFFLIPFLAAPYGVCWGFFGRTLAIGQAKKRATFTPSTKDPPLTSLLRLHWHTLTHTIITKRPRNLCYPAFLNFLMPQKQLSFLSVVPALCPSISSRNGQAYFGHYHEFLSELLLKSSSAEGHETGCLVPGR